MRNLSVDGRVLKTFKYMVSVLQNYSKMSFRAVTCKLWCRYSEHKACEQWCSAISQH